MTAPQLDDRDIEAMFSSPQTYDDREAFEHRVMNRLQIKLWLRHGLVVLAGCVGGLYALAQLIRIPNWTVNGKAAYPAAVQQAVVETDETWRAGMELIDVVRNYLMSLADSSAQYLTYMQTPTFFWIAFSVCMACVGLYYAYSQEETL